MLSELRKIVTFDEDIREYVDNLSPKAWSGRGIS